MKGNCMEKGCRMPNYWIQHGEKRQYFPKGFTTEGRELGENESFWQKVRYAEVEFIPFNFTLLEEDFHFFFFSRQ